MNEQTHKKMSSNPIKKTTKITETKEWLSNVLELYNHFLMLLVNVE